MLQERAMRNKNGADNEFAAVGIVAGIGFLILCAFPSWMLAGALMAIIYMEMARRGSP
jgi:hypothetical protein